MKKRERIHQKYKGLCAYSGTPLEADWEVDHVEPIIRAGRILFPNESDTNLVPCQKSINRYKGAYQLEMFRGLLLTLHKRIKHTPRLPHRIAAKERLLKVAGYFGITPDQPWNGKFYFETTSEGHKQRL